MLKKISLGLVCLFLCSVVWAANDDPYEIIKKAVTAREKLKSLKGTITIAFNDGKTTAFTDYTFTYQAPNKLLATMSLRSSGRINIMTTADGVDLWQYAPSKQQYRKYPLPPEFTPWILNKTTARFDRYLESENNTYIFLGKTVIGDDVPVYKIEVQEPENPNTPVKQTNRSLQAYIYIGQKDYLLRRILVQMTEGEGDNLVNKTIEANVEITKVNPKLPKDTFKFIPPEGSVFSETPTAEDNTTPPANNSNGNEQPADKPVDNTADKPVEKPADTPAEEPPK